MKNYFFIFFYLACFPPALAQTVGLTAFQPNCHSGYVLMSPIASNSTHLLNNCGESVHSWTTEFKPGLSSFVLTSGELLCTGNVNNGSFGGGGGAGGAIQKLSWDNTLIWDISLSSTNECQHHDIYPLPNGNILALIWERKPIAEAVAFGRNPDTSIEYVWSEKIQEIEITGIHTYNVVWEWKAWDHLIQDFDPQLPNYGVVAEHPERLDINLVYGPPNNEDWIHLNSIDYNQELNQIVVSAHNFSEFWVIDYSTTTSEAASSSGGISGRGGDFLYRWGNPQAYDQGNPSTKKLFGQHHVTWIPSGFPDEGKFLVFNNGLYRPQGEYSSVEIVEAPWNGTDYTYTIGSAYGPTAAYWSYTAPIPTDFYSNNISGVYPMADGGFMVTEGNSGRCFQIDAMGEIIWDYVNPLSNNTYLSTTDTPSNNSVFRFTYYSNDYEGLSNVTSSGDPLELNPLSPSLCEFEAVFEDRAFVLARKEDNLLVILVSEPWEVANCLGQTVATGNGAMSLDLSTWSSAVYLLVTRHGVMKFAH
jgi:hypothetical protein